MADEIRIRFACGCVAVLDSLQSHDPQCAAHGTRAITHVQAPPPRFRGVNCNPARSLGPLETTVCGLSAGQK